MDLVSFDTKGEFEMFREIMDRDNVSSVYTSGGGRNFCRDRCMDLVSFDTKGEFEMFREIMDRDNVSSVYTSGRKCNFQNKGCDAAHLAPINVNGWFWAGASNARIPPTDRPAPGEAYWSNTGEKGERQPDNFEGIKNGPINAE